MRARAGRRALGAAAPLALATLLVACGAREVPVPTQRLEPQPFVQRVSAEGGLSAERVTPVSVPTMIRTSVRLAWIAPDGALVTPGEVVARFDPRPMEELLHDGLASLAVAGHRVVEKSAASASEQAGVLTQMEMAQLELELAERFQKRDEDVWSRREILESGIDAELARARRRHAEGKQATQRRRAGSDLALLEIEQRQARLRVDEAETGLAALEVQAPHGGLFLRTRDWRGNQLEVGQELWAGRAVGEIPDLETLQAEVFVLEADAGGIAAGQEAEVVVPARPGVVHPARVVKVDNVAKPRQPGSPVQYFGVTLELLGREAAMKPGQRVRATIYLQRVAEAIVVPRQAISRGGEGPLVHVLENGVFTPRPVELGAASRGLVLVRAGLRAGETVALRPPGPEPTTGSGPEVGAPAREQGP